MACHGGQEDRSAILARGGSTIFLFVAIAAIVTLWAVYPHRLVTSDPAYYSRQAFLIAHEQDFGSARIFNQRLGVLLPVALIYKLFGVSILTTNAWPLMAVLLVTITVWAALPDERSRIAGVFLCLTSVPLFKASVALYPDIVATAFMALSTLALLSRRRLLRHRRAWPVMPLTYVALLLFAFLAKESAYWVLPLLALAVFKDRRTEDWPLLVRRFYAPVIMAGLLAGCAFLLLSAVLWENPLSRFASLQNKTDKHLWSLHGRPLSALVERLTVAPVPLLAQFGVAALLALPGLIIMPRAFVPWAHYTGVCLFFFWFGSTSFTVYEPMPIRARMLLPIAPGLYLLAALFTAHITTRERWPRPVRLLLVVMILAAAAYPFAAYIGSWNFGIRPEERVIAIVRDQVVAHPDREYLLVCADPRSPKSLAFYFGYRYPANLRAVAAEDLTAELLANRTRFIYVDTARARFLRAAYGVESRDREIAALGLPRLYGWRGTALFVSEGEAGLEKLLLLSSGAASPP